MFMFVDGRPVVLSFALVESLYYKAFMERFPESGVSITQWRGSYEYQAIYPDIQMIVETGVITRDAMTFIGNSIVQANEAIKRPACLYSRVPERFKELGYEATIRIADATNKGEVAICVDQARVEGWRVLTTGAASTDAQVIGFNQEGSPPFGTLTNDEFAGKGIQYIQTGPTGTAHLVMKFDAPHTSTQANMYIATQWQDAAAGLASWYAIDAAGAPMGNAGPTQYWKCDKAELVNLFRNNPTGTGLNFNFVDEPASTADDDDLIGSVIRDEMLPAGQRMIGGIVYKTALSNGQPIDIRWAVPTDIATPFRVTITRKRGSPYPEQTVDQIIEIFNANFDEAMGIGADITPQVYLTVRDLPWASSVLVEWSDGVGWFKSDYTATYNTRYVGELLPANVVIQ